MKTTEGIPEIPLPPNVAVIEKGPKSLQERLFDSVHDESIHDPKKVNPKVGSEDFSLAYKTIVGNPELEHLIIQAATDKNPALFYSCLMNELTRASVSLSDENIDNLIRKFKEDFFTRIPAYSIAFNLRENQIDKIQSGILGDSMARGVKPVVHFMRARKTLHEISPKTFSAFYFENYLDARYGVDLIELTEESDGIIVNLIQIKANSHGLNNDDINKYIQNHKKWVDQYMIPIDVYEQSFFSKPSAEQIEIFNKGIENIDEVLFEIITDPVSSQDKDILFIKLGIGGRAFTNAEQLWILNEYLPSIKEACNEFVQTQEIDIETSNKLYSLVNDLENRLEQEMQKKKGLKKVIEVNSICTVDNKEISKVNVFKSENGKQGKAIKMSN